MLVSATDWLASGRYDSIVTVLDRTLSVQSLVRSSVLMRAMITLHLHTAGADAGEQRCVSSCVHVRVRPPVCVVCLCGWGPLVCVVCMCVWGCMTGWMSGIRVSAFLHTSFNSMHALQIFPCILQQIAAALNFAAPVSISYIVTVLSTEGTSDDR